MIELRNVSHAYDGTPVIRNVSAALDTRRIAVLGANGSGKSTFARLLNGLLVPAAGEVLVDGLNTRTAARQVRRKVGLVFQNPEHQIVMPTVEEDLAFGPENLGVPPAEIETRITRLLHGHGLADKRSQPAYLLSGGEKKLLTLLSVLVMEPDYIVLDEPMNSLDLRAQRRIASAIAELPQTVITITHDFELVVDYDRALLFENGAIVADGPPADVISRYRRDL